MWIYNSLSVADLAAWIKVRYGAYDESSTEIPTTRVCVMIEAKRRNLDRQAKQEKLMKDPPIRPDRPCSFLLLMSRHPWILESLGTRTALYARRSKRGGGSQECVFLHWSNTTIMQRPLMLCQLRSPLPQLRKLPIAPTSLKRSVHIYSPGRCVMAVVNNKGRGGRGKQE